MNKVNTLDTEAPFLDLHLSISNGFVSSKLYDKRDAFDFDIVKVKSMQLQRSGTEAIRTQIQPSKPKWEINKITNSQNTKRTYGQQSEQLFPKRWQLSNPTELKIK